MRSIMLTYPGFRALPQGIKKLLLASETFFFAEAQPEAPYPGITPLPVPPLPSLPIAALGNRWHPALGPVWRN